MNKSENSFVNRLKAWRTKNFYSQQRAAALLGITRPYLSQLENGREPSSELVNKFEALELTTSEHPGRIRETAPEYRDLLRKVIYIEEEGTPEQLEMVAAFLDTVCERLGLPKKPASGGTLILEEEIRERPADHRPASPRSTEK